jgi:hypothetical protein
VTTADYFHVKYKYLTTSHIVYDLINSPFPSSIPLLLKNSLLLPL